MLLLVALPIASSLTVAFARPSGQGDQEKYMTNLRGGPNRLAWNA
jgi:hypothetical protein